MTREEAIKGLKVLAKDFSGYKPNEEMFDMAIKALEQPECEDTVSRAAVINAWRNACNSVMSKCACHYDDDIKDTVYDNTSEVNAVLRCNKEFKNALKVLPLITPKQPGWIPVTERLPDVRQWVLCQCRAGIMDVLRLTADGSWNKNYPNTEYMSGFVVAWMPLPPKWEGGQDGN